MGWGAGHWLTVSLAYISRPGGVPGSLKVISSEALARVRRRYESPVWGWGKRDETRIAD